MFAALVHLRVNVHSAEVAYSPPETSSHLMFWTFPPTETCVPHPPFALANAIVSSHLASWWVVFWLKQSDQCSFPSWGASCLALLQDGDRSLVLEGFPADLFALLSMLLVQTRGWHLISVELAILHSITIKEYLGKICEDHFLWLKRKSFIWVLIMNVLAVPFIQWPL